MADTLRAAAQAVVDRWDTPLWKDVPATAEYIGRLRASLAASAGSEPAIGWHAFPHYLQHPDGRLLRTASDLLARHGYTGCAEPLRAMSDVLLSTNPSPPEGSAPAAPPMDGEIALIEKAVKRVGIKSLLNHGAGSLVYSEGVEGVTQDDLLAYTREIALHCAVALGSTPGKMAGWMPIETAPEKGVFLVYMPTADRDGDRIQVAVWHPNVKVVGHLFAFDCAPITHWMPLPAPPLPASEAKEPI